MLSNESSIEDYILRKVNSHYEHSENVLLMSQLGTDLRNSDIWPQEGERRTLLDIIEAMPELTVLRDPSQRAYAVVTPKGREHLAENEIRKRADIRTLRLIPRAVLLAFCIEQPPGASVFVSTSSPFRYAVGASPPDDSYVIVDEQFRMRGLFIVEIADMKQDERSELARKFLAWCQEHQIDSASFLKSTRGRDPKSTTQVTPSHGLASATKPNALERLIASQAPDVASKLVIPADIALLLSRSE